MVWLIKPTDPFRTTAFAVAYEMDTSTIMIILQLLYTMRPKMSIKKTMVNTIGATNDSSNYYGAGSFYLDINSGSEWTVTIRRI